MTSIENSINLNLNDYSQDGLYILFADSTRLTLTRQNIEKVASEYWNDPGKIPPHIKKAVEFQRCPFCPLAGQGDFCDALHPILPFLNIVDQYVSYDKVMAIYKGDDKTLYHLSDTTMQNALKYISILSLMRYCHVGKKYWKYYFGIVPLVNADEAANSIYLNMYWLHRGDKEEIEKTVSTFIEQIRAASQNQVKRLNLICKNDAFLNAFVNTQIATEFLALDIEKRLEKSFREFEKTKSIGIPSDSSL